MHAFCHELLTRALCASSLSACTSDAHAALRCMVLLSQLLSNLAVGIYNLVTWGGSVFAVGCAATEETGCVRIRQLRC
jgi:hypothetical protein